MLPFSYKVGNDMKINVVLENLPCGIRGFTRINDEDSATIVLNARLSQEMNADTYQHECEHIQNEDVNKTAIDPVETIRHK